MVCLLLICTIYLQIISIHLTSHFKLIHFIYAFSMRAFTHPSNNIACYNPLP
jgi:hypothetical protein